MVNCMYEKAKDLIQGGGPENKKIVLKFMAAWIQKIVHCSNLHDMDKRLKDIAVILLSRHHTESVQKRVASLHEVVSPGRNIII